MQKIGLQIYTLRDQARGDLLATIRKVAEAGYEGIEFDQGLRERIGSAELKTHMQQVDIRVIGLTLTLPELGAPLDPMIEYALQTEAEWLVIPWITPDLWVSTDGIETVGQMLNKAGERIAKFGLRFTYHTHGYEFRMLQGRMAIEYLFEILDPKFVELQVDTFWVASAGVDCAAFIETYLDWIGSFHIKDAYSFKPAVDTEVGRGNLDLQEVVNLGVQGDVEWFIVEQEQMNLPWEQSIQISEQNLRRMIRTAQRR